MKLSIFVLGGLLCLGAVAQQNSQPSQDTQKNTQSADRMKRPAATGAHSITGCVDEQNGKYVLRDRETDQLITLQPTGTDANDDFARFVGHQAAASGTMSSGTMTVTQISKVADMCPVGK